MRMRSVALATLTVVGLSQMVATSSVQARQAPSEWVTMSSSWPGLQRVEVSDVAAFGKVAYVVGTTSKDGVKTPWVQVCSGRSCSADRLPRPGGASTTVNAIAGSERADVWAVGYTTANGTHRPVFWHKVGGAWSIFAASLPNKDIVMTQVEVANKSKAFAIGRQRFGLQKDKRTTTLYRWNGTGWKEVGALLDDPPSVFPAPCDGWYNRSWNDVVARPGSAIVFGTCGRLDKLAILEQGDTNWTTVEGNGFPEGVDWQTGAMVGKQVWLVGTRNDRRIIVANDGTGWSRVTTDGLRARAVVSDIAGVFASKVTIVGWIPTGHGHRVARAWRWGAGSWHETEVPAGISKSALNAASVDTDGPVFAVGNDLGRKPHLRALIIHSVG
jgi:hypothetical protein